ncbi:MAG: DsbA family protein [Halorientalis sp.]
MTDRDAIGVYSDYVCPFCYLGRQSLAQYQAGREEPLRIEWHPFDLRADQRNAAGEVVREADGKDESYYEQARENVRRLQDEYDVEMSLELSREVDSLNAQLASYHLQRTRPYETWLAFDEAVLEALWTEERDIGDPDVLADIAGEAGVDPEVVRAALDDEDLRGDLQGEFEAARRRGVTGVPTFTYGDHAARGAVPPEHLRRLVEGA